MDAVSEILSSLRLSGGVVIDGELTGDFCVRAEFTPNHCAPFFAVPEALLSYHYVRSGRALVQIEGHPPAFLQTGDIAILPRNDPHLLASREGLTPADADRILWVTKEGVHRIESGTSGPTTEVWCGFLGTGKESAHPLLEALPPLLTIPSKPAGGEWLDSSLRFLAEEHPSPETVAKLAEVFVGEAIRQYLQKLPQDAAAWLRGLTDPAVSRALSVIHRRYAEDLTIEGLARDAGVSRTVLRERFVELIGEPPMRYCAKWRMRTAATMLREGKDNTANIAYSVGFNSEAAFNRAFKREFGEPPATWRRRRQAEAAERLSLSRRELPPQKVCFCQAADGAELAYSVVGEGFPVVKAPNCFTHLEHDGSNPIHRHWSSELSRSNRLIRCDMRGFGMCDRTRAKYSMDCLVDDLTAVIDSAEIEQCHLLGLTHGAAVAIAYCARHPERVRKLVLVNAFAAGWAVRGDPDEVAWRQSLIRLNRKRWARDGVALGEQFVSTYFPSAAAEMIDWHKERFDDLGSAENLEALLEWGAHIDVRKELSNIKAPALIFHSKNDGNAAVEVGRAVAEAITGAHFVELDSSNHFILEDEPAWSVLVREMRTFLTA